MTTTRTALPKIQMVTVDDVRQTLDVSKMTVYRLIHSGQLRAYRFGRQLRIDPRDVVDFIQDADTVRKLGVDGAA